MATSAQPSPPTPDPVQQGLRGFLAFATDGVVFVQWTETGGTLTGSLTEAYTTPGDQTNLQHQNASFTGVVSGTSVTLTFPQGLSFGATWTGTLTGDALTLSYPANDGTLSTLTFGSGSVSDYNAVVSNLQAQVQRALATQQAEADAAAAQAALDRAVASASGALSAAISQLNSDVSRATDATADMTQSAARANDTLVNVRVALARVRAAASVTPMDDYQLSSVCYEVGAVEYEIGGIRYYTDPVRTNGSLVSDAVSSATTDTVLVGQAVADLEAAISADPTGPAPNTSPASGRAAVQASKRALEAVRTAASSALKSATASDATAADLLVQAKNVAASVGASC